MPASSADIANRLEDIHDSCVLSISSAFGLSRCQSYLQAALLSCYDCRRGKQQFQDERRHVMGPAESHLGIGSTTRYYKFRCVSKDKSTTIAIIMALILFTEKVLHKYGKEELDNEIALRDVQSAETGLKLLQPGPIDISLQSRIEMAWRPRKAQIGL